MKKLKAKRLLTNRNGGNIFNQYNKFKYELPTDKFLCNEEVMEFRYFEYKGRIFAVIQEIESGVWVREVYTKSPELIKKQVNYGTPKRQSEKVNKFLRNNKIKIEL